MHRPFRNPVFWAGTAVTLAAGIALLGLWAWLRPLSLGEAAAREGRLDVALEYFTAAESRLDRTWLRGLVPGAYEASRVNQFRILYQLGEFDRLQALASAGPDRAPEHFWAGAALYRLAMAESEKDARLAWLRRAGDEFYDALKLAPDQWDHKYNYELTERLIAALEDEEEPPPQTLELLRPKPREGDPPTPPAG